MGKMSGSSSPYIKFLYYLAKFWGFAPFELRNNGISCESWRSTVCSLICCLICFSGIVKITIEIVSDYHAAGINLLKFSDFTNTYVSATGAMISLLTFVTKRKKIVDIVRLFIEFDGVLKSCGTGQFHGEIFKRRAWLAATYSVVLIFSEYSSAITYRYFVNKTDLYINSAFTVFLAHEMCNFVFHYMIVIFVNVMLLISRRISVMNNTIACLCEGRPTVDKFEMIEEMYEKINEITDKTMKLFSVPLIIVSGLYSLKIMVLVYFNSVTARRIITPLTSLIVVSSTISIGTLLLIFELFAVAFVCDSAQKMVSDHESYIFITSGQIHNRLQLERFKFKNFGLLSR